MVSIDEEIIRAITINRMLFCRMLSEQLKAKGAVLHIELLQKGVLDHNHISIHNTWYIQTCQDGIHNKVIPNAATDQAGWQGTTVEQELYTVKLDPHAVIHSSSKFRCPHHGSCLSCKQYSQDPTVISRIWIP